jgi:hypothetical protein
MPIVPAGGHVHTRRITGVLKQTIVALLFWSRRPGQYVVHLDDFQDGVAYTNIFLPDGKASRARGTLVEIK